MGFPKNPLRDP